ncbi:MAG: hypothetical protein CMF60_05800 [Magnetococcales bacterium]|nr:hypothetical protein [Magnetococcales bacterium]|tara:strand:- start:8671 stop:9300 length:630 start_codon:yes stop_codon:yes gene_type:complete
MAYRSSLFLFVLSVLFASQAWAKKDEFYDWSVESELKKLEVMPAYAGEETPFPVQEKPKEVVRKRVVKVDKPKELTPEQMRALQAADVLNEIRSVLKREEIFNADTSNLAVDAVMKVDGVKSALIKNRWYSEGETLDVPVAAKENLLSLVSNLKELDQSLAEVVEGQVNEKIRLVKNLSLRVEEIKDDAVLFIDEQKEQHVIKFKAQNF